MHAPQPQPQTKGAGTAQMKGAGTAQTKSALPKTASNRNLDQLLKMLEEEPLNKLLAMCSRLRAVRLLNEGFSTPESWLSLQKLRTAD